MRLSSCFVKSLLLSQLMLFAALPVVLAQKESTVSPHKPIKVSGKVADDKGVPLAGVSVQVKGGQVIAVTDNNGEFTGTANEGSILQFTSQGYGMFESPVKNQQPFMVNLNIDSKSLDDVVVVGYGTQKKRAVTGSVVSVGYDQFKDRSFSNVAQALEGAIAGVNISTSQGAPGFGPTIKIRGTSSITAGTTPLYVVDGNPFSGDLSSINPSDIESISVLKDAASSALITVWMPW